MMSLFGLMTPIIIICLLGLFSYLFLRTRGRHRRTRTNKAIYMKLGLYALALLVSMGLVLAIPYENDVGENTVDTNNIPNLHTLANDKWDNDLVKSYIADQKRFQYEDDILDIHQVMLGSSWFSIYVLVEEKDEADSTIEATVYQTPSIFDGVDITHDIDPLQMELQASRLTITAEDNELTYAYFKSEFPFSRFEKNRQPMFEEEMIKSKQVVYLRIPKNLQIRADEDINLLYVD